MIFFPLSNYPSQRVKQDENKQDMGVAGTLSLLQNVTLSTQPINAFDWSPDKEGLCVCSAFDQTIRVLIVTKLNRIWSVIFKHGISCVIVQDVFPCDATPTVFKRGKVVLQFQNEEFKTTLIKIPVGF